MRRRIWQKAPGVGLTVAALAAVLGGCRLVDQTTFGATPHPPPPDALASAFASGGRVPLLVIQPADEVPYTEALDQAVAAAEARNGSVVFTLVGVVPASGDEAAQTKAMDHNADAAHDVLDEMGQDGISPERVTLRARVEPNVTEAEIRLYEGTGN